MMKRFLAAFIFAPSIAFAQVSALPANQFMASPLASTGFLAPRTLGVNDFNGGTGASASTCWKGDGTWGTCGSTLTYSTVAGTTVSMTNNTAADMTSVSLAAGDWECRGGVAFTVSANAFRFRVATSTTSATLPTSPAGGYFDISFSSAALISSVIQAGVERYNLGSTTTVYLVALTTFSTGTVDGKGTIECRKLG